MSLQTERIKMMLNKLKIEVENNRIKNDWESNFIYDMYEKAKLDIILGL